MQPARVAGPGSRGPARRGGRADGRTRHRRPRGGTIACALAMALAAGGAGARAGHAGPATDMLGRPVTLPARAARIVSLAPSITETLFAVGAGERVVGVTEHCDHPPEAARRARVGGLQTPSFEAILALRPDLVLATSESNRAEHVRQLESLGLPVYVIRPVDFATVLESIERIGAVVGREAEGRGLVGSMRREADAIGRAVAPAPRRRTLYVVWPSPLVVPGRGTLITELIERAGGESVTAAEPLPYPRLSLETVVQRRPEVIIVGRHGRTPVEEMLRDWERLGPVLGASRITGVDGDLVHRPGPRMIEALRALARALHPERVP